MCRFGDSRTFFLRRNHPAVITRVPSASIDRCTSEINIVGRSGKMIATLASVAVLACSILAASWVGLALLGY